MEINGWTVPPGCELGRSLCHTLASLRANTGGALPVQSLHRMLTAKFSLHGQEDASVFLRALLQDLPTIAGATPPYPWHGGVIWQYRDPVLQPHQCQELPIGVLALPSSRDATVSIQVLLDRYFG